MYRKIASNIFKYPKRGILQSSQKSVYLPETIVTTLPSGFRVATENTGGQTATIGVWIDAGSRYETEKNNGTAHFLEHMAFKGTQTRTRSSLELEVENLGSHLNAYTSREHTTYFAKCFSENLDNSVDILSDILLRSRLDKRDINSERGVIIREMEEVEQNFQEVVFDLLHLGVFHGNPLSMTILGPVENINSIDRNDLTNYIKTHYRSGRMILAASGGIKHDEVVRLAEKYFGELEHGDSSAEFNPAVYNPCEIRKPVNDKTDCHGALVVEGVSWTHEDNLSLMVANTLLGEFDRSRGFGVNAPSRLATRIGQDTGIELFQAFNTCYRETGLVGVYFVAKPESANVLINAIISEWKYLAKEVNSEIVERGKKTLLTNLLLMLDGSTPICEDIGRQLLCYGRRIPVLELEHRIREISVDRIREVCQKIFVNGQISTTLVGATENWPSVEEIQASLNK